MTPSTPLPEGKEPPIPAPAAAPDLRPADPPTLGDIPWAYGDNRVTAMARDPHWAFAYWEVSDPALFEARGRARDASAGLALRVYDSTHRLFDGQNAHHHFDLGVDRAMTCTYFRVGRPGSTIHVEIGVRAADGTYAPIARSAAVGMPRDFVSPDGHSQWSTVLRPGPGYSYRHRFAPPTGSPPGPAAPPGSHPPAEFERVFQHLAGEGWTRAEGTETLTDGRVVRWIRWTGPHLPGPLPREPLGASAPTTHVEVLFQGEGRVVRFESGESLVYGPWRIVIEAIGPHGERRTIHPWALRHRWTKEELAVRAETPAILTRIQDGGGPAARTSGSQERLSLEAWGSEFLRAGASEWRWIGASESARAGSPETLELGASETLLTGGSGPGPGAGERPLPGGGESLPPGASGETP